jgi:hypothetical protein
MEQNNGNPTHFIVIDLDEHLAGIYDTHPGTNYLDCTGDLLLKALYLEQELTQSDIKAWEDDTITDHARELLEDIDVDVAEVSIEYSCEKRRYEFEVTEKEETPALELAL